MVKQIFLVDHNKNIFFLYIFSVGLTLGYCAVFLRVQLWVLVLSLSTDRVVREHVSGTCYKSVDSCQTNPF